MSDDDAKDFVEDMTYLAKEAEKPPAPMFTSEAFKKAFDALLSRRPKTFNEMLKFAVETTSPNSRYVMPRSVAASLGIDVSGLPGNLVQVWKGKIEGIYVEPEEAPVEKKHCDECDDSGLVTEVDYSDGPNFPCFGESELCPHRHHSWHHPLP